MVVIVVVVAAAEIGVRVVVGDGATYGRPVASRHRGTDTGDAPSNLVYIHDIHYLA